MNVVLYTWSSCSFCERAKRLLEERGIAFQERPLDGNRRMADQLTRVFGTRTMPYVFLDDEPLGGLAELEQHLAGG